MIFSPARMIVGVKLTPQQRLEQDGQLRVGSLERRERRGKIGGVEPEGAQQRVGLRTWARSAGGVRCSARSSGPIRASALSPMRGTEAWPALPAVVSVKRNTPFSATQTP